MRILIHRLGSLKIAVTLLTLIMIAMAAGTMIESIRGTETALAQVYYSLWFRALLGLFALNVLFSLIDLFPWGTQRIGFVLTHGSMLLILLGALLTDRAKIEGRLALWEGEESSVFQESPGPGEEREPRTLELPFTVHLDAFEIDYYQGTRRPAMFRSRVTVHDPNSGARFPAVIEMNRELAHAGYRLFQTAYNETPERDQTILTVSRDPGQPIVFAGYTLLMVGMTTVLVTRALQRRAIGRVQAAAGNRALRRAAALCLGLALAAAGPAAASASSLDDPRFLDDLRRLPVQHDGRVMPLDTLAREAVRQVTGADGWDGRDPVALALGWRFEPERSAGLPMVRIGSADLAEAIGLPPGTRHASFSQLVRNRALIGYIQQARAAEERDEPVAGLLKDAQKLEGRLVWVQRFMEGQEPRAVPDPTDPALPWSVPDPLRSPADLAAIANAAPAAALVAPGSIEREITYNAVRPSRLAWWILVPATIASIVAWSRRRRWLDALSIGGLLSGFAVMTWGLAVRWQVAGRIPASNMYESLLFLAWGVGLFAVVALLFMRNRLIVLNAAAMSALTMTLADLLPIDPFIHPMPPVLSGTAWLAIHVPIIMVSYSVLALGVVVAHMQIGVEIVAPARRDLALRMNDLLYWYMHAGAILLIAGILTGSIWAASSWGRYWGWDPKEVWSLIAFLAYLAILHGRFDRFIGTFGVAALSIVAFWMIVMTYIGVNYVLAAGLHSYGFGGASVVRWMLVVAALEGLFLGVGHLAHSTALRRPGENPA
jgi:ABC-type transport system involved in cytochrome c biogenesis permease subunit